MTGSDRDAAVPALAGGVAREEETSTVDYPTEKCRTCQAPIIWATTASRKDMPVDAGPAPGGNIALIADDRGNVRASVVAAHLAFGRSDLRLSHFVKCKDAAKWRRR